MEGSYCTIQSSGGEGRGGEGLKVVGDFKAMALTSAQAGGTHAGREQGPECGEKEKKEEGAGEWMGERED